MEQTAPFAGSFSDLLGFLNIPKAGPVRRVEQQEAAPKGKMNPSTVLKKLRVYMTANHLTEAGVAEAIGVESQTVAYWLAGTHLPRPQNVLRILAAFNLNDPYGAQKASTSSPSTESGSDATAKLSALLQQVGSLEATMGAAVELLLEQAAAMEAQRTAASYVRTRVAHSCRSSSPDGDHRPSNPEWVPCDGSDTSDEAA